jgi:hypothetical protein
MQTMFERGSRNLFAAITRARAGLPTLTSARLLWDERTSSTVRDPNSKSFAVTLACAERFRAREEMAERQRVAPRDPCPVCNTRRDYGCEHVRRDA